MGSTVIDSKSYFFSTSVGFVRTDITTVTGYDIEDIVHDKAISQARAIAFMNIGKSIDPTKPLAARSMPSIWLNNEESLEA
jgi:hypothetical protein